MQRIKDLVKESHRKKKLDYELEGDQQQAESTESRVPEESNLLDEQSYSSTGGIKEDTSKASSSNFQSSRRDASSSKVPMTSSKGWHNVEAANIYRSKVYGISKKEHKLKGSNDFFSRMSFNELGYSDSIIESLKNLQYVRPSHIQVCQTNLYFFQIFGHLI